ncbi:hypothetical protein VP01_1006g3 [Puccinia sorghi]|uniref:LIM zinc-binding domain-containing protein n=1 Tax=Puccinia sorghi TaxID=27349 RepID=A0A0L6VWK3_9BASI|nr:hypothetical protein VP01_1006g3 [Puccinia sorghi]
MFIHLNHPRSASNNLKTRSFTQTRHNYCPVCLKSVFAAEQALGPAAIPYHKTCLRCTLCRKLLDQSNLLEHAYHPYCKICHSKNFGTKGVGYGNAVVPEYSPRSPCNPSSTSTPHTLPATLLLSTSHPPFEDSYCPSPPSIDSSRPKNLSVSLNPPSPQPPIHQQNSISPSELSSLHIYIKSPPTPSSQPLEEENLLQERGELSSTPLSSAPQPKKTSLTPPTKPSKPAFSVTAAQAAFSLDGPQRCPACTQTVYHAEQVLAIGKKWHKRCLRCTSCARALDSNLAERAGKPYCPKCYDQLFGAAANGFVLVSFPLSLSYSWHR